MNLINLPVSIGEGLDKLTILDIKLEKIKDNRKLDVQKEYDILYDKLNIYISKYEFYYKILKQTNLDIWNMQDDFRYNNTNKSDLCFKIIEENDRRFRIKKKINEIANSSLKEQKGYKPKKAFVLTHLGLGDNITSIGAVRYLSTVYDIVYVVCKTKYEKNLKLFYEDDASIKLYPVLDDKYISPNLGFDINKFKDITKNMDVYLAGSHKLSSRTRISQIPFSFYYDMGINHTYFWEYFHVNKPKMSLELFNKLKNIDNYIFIHNTSSTHTVFNIDDLNKLKKDNVKLNINKYKTLVINPNINLYSENDEFFNIAEKFVNIPLAYYIDTIINAGTIIVTDSSFFCLILNLPIKTKDCYYISRDNVNYDYLTNNKLIKQLRV